jgi:hypoxanthine phosphoribosyltransferase
VASIRPSERLTRLVSKEEIERRVHSIAADIRRDVAGGDLVVVGVLNGAFVFTADLVRALAMPLEVDFVRLASYGASRTSSGRVAVTKSLERPITGRDVLVVEDILDTGHSLAVLLDELSQHAPRSVRICVLVDKPERRVIAVHADYTGFVVPKGFVVGYGIDYAERYRALPDLYRLDVEGDA